MNHLLFFCLILPTVSLSPPVPDIPYEHFFHHPRPFDNNVSYHDSIFLPLLVDDKNDRIYVGTDTGLYTSSISNVSNWSKYKHEIFSGPIFDICADKDEKIYIGKWNGLYIIDQDVVEQVQEIGNVPVSAIRITSEKKVVGSPEGIWISDKNNNWTKLEVSIPRSIRDIAVDRNGDIWIATENGLAWIRHDKTKMFTHKTDLWEEDNPEEHLISNNLSSLCIVDSDEIWVGGLGGINILKDGKIIRKLTHTNFPSAWITKIYFDNPTGKIWIGTQNGLIYLENKDTAIQDKKTFRSLRWLLHDDVRDIYVIQNNVYVSTAKGVSKLSIELKTLQEKAEYFEQVTQQRHTREPGIVEKCRLRIPGEVSSWEPMDDDNDGGYTTMYLASLALRFAVTQEPEVRNRAKMIFRAITFLEEVTELPGFIARTVVPSTWTEVHDPNQVLSPENRAYMRVLDPRYKPVEIRWRKSRDGKWLWKGDTSSDEITAHFFGWAIYYDFCADDEDKKLLQSLVTRVMDKIIQDGFTLKDIDGTHTRWAVWSPERLKFDPDWANERGINALEILSYLKTAYHITKDTKYQQIYEHLLKEENYAIIVRRAKNYGASARTHIDDELLAFTYPSLLRYETEEKWLEIYKESIQHWYDGIKNEHNPFFNFIYAWCMGADPNLTNSIHTLREIPYDLINWTVDNTTREDIQLVRHPILEDIQTSRLLPPGETGVIRWDKNRWQAIQGDGGRTEWAPTFYLFPYWLGRFLKLIQ